MLIDFGERGRKGEVGGEKHACERETSIDWLPLVSAQTGSVPQPEPTHLPQLGIEPVTLQLWDDTPANQSTLARAKH